MQKSAEFAVSEKPSKYYLHKFRPKFDLEKKRRCVMFQLKKTSEPRSWYIRIRREDGTYFQTSLDETNRAEAIRKAQQVYFEFTTASNRGVVYGKNTFKRIYSRFINEKHFNAARKSTIESRYRRYLTWFDNYEVHNIKQKLFDEFIVWRCNYWKNYGELKDTDVRLGRYGRGGAYNRKEIPSATTLKQDRQILIQVLRYACQKNLLDVVPEIDSNMKRYADMDGVNISFKKTRGKAIPDKQFKSIIGKLRSYCISKNKEPNPERRFARHRIWYFIMITNNSMLRPGTEATRLKWSDLGKVPSRKSPGEFIYYFNVREGKKQRYGHDDSIKMITPNGLKQLLMWRKLCTEEYKEFNIGNDEDFIFPKLDKSELQTHYMSRMFRKILKKWDEEDLIIAEKKNRKPKLFSEDSTGTNITLYSFRHTKIVNLLIYSGRPASEVAQMADTSLLTLSRAYLQTQMLADADRYADHSINRDAFERQSDEDKKFIADAMKDFGM